MSKQKFTEEEKAEIEKTRKENRDKKAEKRLEALSMRAEGKRNKEISEKTGFHIQYITMLVTRYKTNGINSIVGNHYKGNRRNLTYEEEEQILEPYRKAAEEGKLITVQEIETAYREKVGHSIGTSQIYYVLHRHGWRKIMPRSRHPKKASEEDIESSKKLNKKSVK